MNQKQLEELFVNMEELVFRVANVVVAFSPASKDAMQWVFDEWNQIVKDILKE